MNENDTTISVEDLNETTEPVDTVVATDTAVVTPPIPTDDTFATEKETDVSESVARQQELLGGLTGQSEFTTGLELEQDIAGKEEYLQGIVSQLETLDAESKIIPMEIQEESFGRGRTVGGTAPLEAGRLRKNAIAQLGLNASFQAAKGNLELAQSFVDRAVAAEFDPIREQLAAEQANLNLLLQMPDLTASEKQQIAQVQAEIDAEKARVEQDAATRQSIQELAIEARVNGASEADVQNILNSQTIDEAIVASTGFVSEETKLDLDIKRANLEKSRFELSLLRKYGGMTPTQYAASLQDTQDAIDAAGTLDEQNRLKGDALFEKITLLGSVLDSSAIDSVVGPSFVSRAPVGVFEKGKIIAGTTLAGAGTGAVAGLPFAGVGAIPGAIGGGIIGLATGIGISAQGSVDYFTGSDDLLIGQVEQFISKEFLDSLINVKAMGGTFGALQKAEQDALTNAATVIGHARVTQGKGEAMEVVGYDMSEKDFRKEIETIQRLTRKAYTQATGKILTPDQEALLSGTAAGAEASAEDYY